MPRCSTPSRRWPGGPRGRDPAGRARRAGRSRRRARRDRAGHRAGRGDAGQQRDRRDPAGRRACRDRACGRARCSCATRCRAMAGCRSPTARPDRDLGAQDPRPQGHRRAVGARRRRRSSRCSTAAGRRRGCARARCRPALCAGFGAAAQLARERRDERCARMSRGCGRWRSRGWSPTGRSTAAAEHRYHGNLNIRRDGLDVARLMSDLRDIAFSAGSACASGSGRPSHVLARDRPDATREARSSIRLGFGRYTTRGGARRRRSTESTAAAQRSSGVAA